MHAKQSYSSEANIMSSRRARGCMRLSFVVCVGPSWLTGCGSTDDAVTTESGGAVTTGGFRAPAARLLPAA